MGLNKPVGFTTAKLLKAKRFDEKIKHAYVNTAPFSESKDELSEYILPQNHNKKEHRTSAPTIAEVVMWLYEKHGIWIQPFILNKTFAWKVEEIKREITWCLFSQQDKGYNSPTKAYEAAIEHVLTKLI